MYTWPWTHLDEVVMWLIMPSDPIVGHLIKTRLSHYFLYHYWHWSMYTVERSVTFQKKKNFIKLCHVSLFLENWQPNHQRTTENGTALSVNNWFILKRAWSSYGAHGKFGEHELRRVTVAQGAAEGNFSFLSAFRTSQVRKDRETIKEVYMLTFAEFLPVTALRVWDQETNLLWFESFDLFCLLPERRCLQARRWRDKQGKCYLYKYIVHALCCALPVNFRALFPRRFFAFPGCLLLSFDWSVYSGKVPITNQSESQTDLINLFLCTCSSSLVVYNAIFHDIFLAWILTSSPLTNSIFCC